MPPKKQPAKRKPGKPLKDPSGRQRVISFGVAPRTAQLLERIGRGSVQDGLRALIAKAEGTEK